jgi:hypothetical protein
MRWMINFGTTFGERSDKRPVCRLMLPFLTRCLDNQSDRKASTGVVSSVPLALGDVSPDDSAAED